MNVTKITPVVLAWKSQPRTRLTMDQTTKGRCRVAAQLATSHLNLIALQSTLRRRKAKVMLRNGVMRVTLQTCRMRAGASGGLRCVTATGSLRGG